MPTLRYRSHDFPSTKASVRRGLHSDYPTTWADILWGAITVGRRQWIDVIANGNYSYLEVLYRAFMIRANIDAHNQSSELIKTAAYLGLDPSEKSAVSYFLGLAFTKLFANDVLGVPWLMHFDVYNHLYPMTAWDPLEKKRPDLFGFDSVNDWVVIESKGRSGGFDRTTFNYAKGQASTIRKIASKIPAIQAVSQLYFDGVILHFRLDDPPQIHENALEIEVSNEQFLSDYYKPFLSLIRENAVHSETREGDRFQIVDFEEAGIKVGISLGLTRMLDKNDWSGVMDFSLRHDRGSSRPDVAIGRDGILIETTPEWNKPLDNTDSRNRLVVR